MSMAPKTPAYLRTEEAPLLPAPISMVGIQGWIIANLFPTIGNGIVSILAGSVPGVDRLGRFGLGDLQRRVDWRQPRSLRGRGGRRVLAFRIRKVRPVDLRFLSDRPALAGQHLFRCAAPRR